jgi:uncharacterized protein (TIGR00645 family)
MTSHPDLILRRLTPAARIIFLSRWLQLPLYLGLIVAQCVYAFRFAIQLWELLHGAVGLSEEEVMLAVLNLIDVVMIANLLTMVIIGGYETFVSRLRLQGHPDQPEWLSHVNANVLKVKLATALIGISSVHLLITFIHASKENPTAIFWQVMIHLTFVFSALALAVIDRISLSRPHSAEHEKA